MKKLYYDLDKRKYLTETDIRTLDLKCETEHILNNMEDFASGLLRIEGQCDFLKNSIYGDIDNIVQQLNEYYNFNIQTQDKNIDYLLNLIENSEDIYYIRELTKQVKEIIKEEEKNKDNALVYIGDRLYYNAETGDYVLKSTFDKDNLLELYKIIKGEK